MCSTLNEVVLFCTLLQHIGDGYDVTQKWVTGEKKALTISRYNLFTQSMCNVMHKKMKETTGCSSQEKA